jgi:hypothetical protein
MVFVHCSLGRKREHNHSVFIHLGGHGKIILKWILTNERGRLRTGSGGGFLWTRFSYLWCLKDREFLDYLNECQFLKKDSDPWSQFKIMIQTTIGYKVKDSASLSSFMHFHTNSTKKYIIKPIYKDGLTKQILVHKINSPGSFYAKWSQICTGNHTFIPRYNESHSVNNSMTLITNFRQIFI